MKCMIKRIDNNSYFNKNLKYQNHWTFINDARVFDNFAEARKIIKKYNLKKVEVVKCTK